MIFLGWISPSSEATLLDVYAKGSYIIPTQDVKLGGNSDVTLISANISTTNWTSLSFSRNLKTGDSYDFDIDNSDIYVLWAYGDDNSVDYATNIYAQVRQYLSLFFGSILTSSVVQHIDSGILQLNLFTGSCQPSADKSAAQVAHAFFMIIAWTLLFVPGKFGPGRTRFTSINK